MPRIFSGASACPETIYHIYNAWKNPRRKGDISMIRGHPEKQKGNRWSIRKEEQRNVAEV